MLCCFIVHVRVGIFTYTRAARNVETCLRVCVTTHNISLKIFLFRDMLSTLISLCAAYLIPKKIYAREITRANLYMQIMRTHKFAFIAADRKGLIKAYYLRCKILFFVAFYIYIG